MTRIKHGNSAEQPHKTDITFIKAIINIGGFQMNISNGL